MFITNLHSEKEIASTSSSRKPDKKQYQKCMRGCVTFEEFSDLLKESVQNHYENLRNSCEKASDS